MIVWARYTSLSFTTYVRVLIDLEGIACVALRRLESPGGRDRGGVGVFHRVMGQSGKDRLWEWYGVEFCVLVVSSSDILSPFS